MTRFPQTHTRTRSPRVHVPNREPVYFNLGNHQVSAVLRKLSLTGGLAEFDGTVGKTTLAEVRMDTVSGPVRGLVEFLTGQRTIDVHAHPFRFVALGDTDYKRLHTTLQMLRQKGFGENAAV